MEARRQTYLHRYADVVNAVLIAVDHLDAGHIDLRPHPKDWSARETLHYLAESEMHESNILRRMLAENKPVLPHWDIERYRERLFFDRPIERSVALFEASARANIELLRLLSEAQWQREGNLQKPWPLTVDGWLEDHVTDLHNRLMQVLNATTGGRAIPDPD